MVLGCGALLDKWMDRSPRNSHTIEKRCENWCGCDPTIRNQAGPWTSIVNILWNVELCAHLLEYGAHGCNDMRWVFRVRFGCTVPLLRLGMMGSLPHPCSYAQFMCSCRMAAGVTTLENWDAIAVDSSHSTALHPISKNNFLKTTFNGGGTRRFPSRLYTCSISICVSP